MRTCGSASSGGPPTPPAPACAPGPQGPPARPLNGSVNFCSAPDPVPRTRQTAEQGRDRRADDRRRGRVRGGERTRAAGRPRRPCGSYENQGRSSTVPAPQALREAVLFPSPQNRHRVSRGASVLPPANALSRLGLPSPAPPAPVTHGVLRGENTEGKGAGTHTGCVVITGIRIVHLVPPGLSQGAAISVLPAASVPARVPRKHSSIRHSLTPSSTRRSLAPSHTHRPLSLRHSPLPPPSDTHTDLLPSLSLLSDTHSFLRQTLTQASRHQTLKASLHHSLSRLHQTLTPSSVGFLVPHHTAPAPTHCPVTVGSGSRPGPAAWTCPLLSKVWGLPAFASPLQPGRAAWPVRSRDREQDRGCVWAEP